LAQASSLYLLKRIPYSLFSLFHFPSICHFNTVAAPLLNANKILAKTCADLECIKIKGIISIFHLIKTKRDERTIIINIPSNFDDTSTKGETDATIAWHS
jgi:hypothetical protein